MYSCNEITDPVAWDAFIDACDPNSFLSSWAWGAVEEDVGRKVHRLGIYKREADGQIMQIGAVFGVSVRARRGNMLVCPHNPVFLKGTDMKAIKDVLFVMRDALAQIARREACVCVRVCPLFADTPENNALFKSAGFRPAPIHVYSELSWILDITLDEEALLAGMKKNTRYGIRKAEKDGIEVTSSTNPEDISHFWDLYIKTASRQHFVVYPKKLLEAEFRRFAADNRARWYFARYKGEVVSAAFITYSSTTAFYHHGASLHTISSITPSEALQWKVIQDAKTAGLRRYNFWGVVPDAMDGHPWAGLSKFKKGFGGYAEAYVHAQDYVLSVKYLLTWSVETVRRWKRKV